MGGSASNLDKLADFLEQYPERTAEIEGHTDNVGSADLNRGLSQRRADSVKNYLVQQGVESSRLSTTGKGFDSPVAGNDSAAGRQQNRRVEIIISESNATSSL
jgi:outer membrane protein OmpA-like peptidoglycan-associated protein